MNIIASAASSLDCRIEIINSKFEYRNPKQIQNSKAQNSKQKQLDAWGLFWFWSFVFWAFEFVSNFGFRASDLFFFLHLKLGAVLEE